MLSSDAPTVVYTSSALDTPDIVSRLGIRIRESVFLKEECRNLPRRDRTVKYVPPRRHYIVLHVRLRHRWGEVADVTGKGLSVMLHVFR